MPKIKYICFDIGRVANVPLSQEEMICRGQNYFGADFSEQTLQKMVFPSLAGRDLWREFQNGKIGSEQYIEAAFQMVTIPSTSENKKIFHHLLKDWCGVAYHPVLNLVDTLNQNGYQTSILSNNNEIMYHTPSADSLKRRVPVAISSHEIGVSKPHWEAYAILLGKVNADAPQEVIFIDDKIKNIAAASSCGLQGIHFRSREIGMDGAFAKLMEELRKKGIKI